MQKESVTVHLKIPNFHKWSPEDPFLYGLRVGLGEDVVESYFAMSCLLYTSKVSLKTMTLDNKKQKVNDALGNPVEIGIIVIWKVKNATWSVLNVENYKEYLSIQCDAVTRNAARNYPYDTAEELSLIHI